MMDPALGRAEPPASQRPDLVAKLTSGLITFSTDDDSTSAQLAESTVSLSTDDPFCVAAPDHPCRYSVNEVHLRARDFSHEGMLVEQLEAYNWYPALGAYDHGTGLRLGMTFNVTGVVDGERVVFEGTSTEPNVLLMVIDPTRQQVTLMGSLSGSAHGHTLSLSLHATSDAPFANLPPQAAAGPDQIVSTSCYANVQLDKSGTTDPNGNFSHAYFTEHGFSIGSGAEPIAMFPGVHHVELWAFDKLGARSIDDVTIDVLDDGSASSACAITPTLVCVRPESDGRSVARFSYENAVRYESTTVPLGVANRFAMAPENRGQPEFFSAGLFNGESTFEVSFEEETLTWIVGERSAMATRTSPLCP